MFTHELFISKCVCMNMIDGLGYEDLNLRCILTNYFGSNIVVIIIVNKIDKPLPPNEYRKNLILFQTKNPRKNNHWIRKIIVSCNCIIPEIVCIMWLYFAVKSSILFLHKKKLQSKMNQQIQIILFLINSHAFSPSNKWSSLQLFRFGISYF